DSLGRVQLAAAIEDRLGTVESNGLLEEVQTLGELRKLVAGDLGESEEDREQGTGNEGTREQGSGNRDQGRSDALPAQLAAVEPAQISAAAPGTSAANQRAAASQAPTAALAPPPRRRSIYPTWPWWPPVQWIRSFYIECLARPFMWILSNPRNVPPPKPLPREPMIIIANHVSSYDAAFMQLALPGFLRRHMAIAMSGDMLDDFLHWRNPWRPGDKRFYPFGPPAWFLVTALYNVFPLANRRDFQSSFMHAGKALDRGYSVMIFPEGTLSRDGTMARFRPGIGLLVKQSSVPVLPMALLGLGELKLRKRKWFHSGTVEVRVGEPIHFAPETSEAEITARLQAEVEKLMGGTSDSTERPEPVATSY
ncbi:MAG: lysophospholipid acyltransferase family protein, partial [Terracidiphilus sp.]